jgi:hypothetical protein
MSIALDSFESVLRLAMCYYDEYAPLYFDKHYLDLLNACLGLITQKKEQLLVMTRVTLSDVISLHEEAIYISMPLLVEYVNLPIEIPVSAVTFVNNFNIFDAINKPEGCEEIDRAAYASSNLPLLQFKGLSVPQMIRFNLTVRIIMLCQRVYQIIKGRLEPNMLQDIDEALEVAQTNNKRMRLN